MEEMFMMLGNIQLENYKGFYKVDHNGGTFVSGTFYNPTTNEWFSTCLADYDYSDGSRDNPILYDMDINYEMQKEFCHKMSGKIYENDEIIIYKGRKMVGEHKVVERITTYEPNQWIIVYYLLFTDGTRCLLDNCKLATDYEKPIQVRYFDSSTDKHDGIRSRKDANFDTIKKEYGIVED